MGVAVKTEWAGARHADLRPGDIFAARMGGADVMALLATEAGSEFVLVLAHRGPDADLERHPPPAGRGFKTFESGRLKFTGRAEARPAPCGTAPGFPGVPSIPSHGALLVAGDGEPWIFVRDHLSPQQVVEYFVSLRTGEMAPKRQGALYAEWGLVAVGDDGEARLLARFAPDAVAGKA